MLVCNNNKPIEDHLFAHVLSLLQPNDVLVVNDTKVLKARLEGHKASGGKIEVMLERILDDRRFTAMIRASKSPKPGSEIVLAGAATARVLTKHDMMYELELLESSLSLPDLLDTYGALPLPPTLNTAPTHKTMNATKPCLRANQVLWQPYSGPAFHRKAATRRTGARRKAVEPDIACRRWYFPAC